MTSKSPIFPIIMPEPQHFSDYGFDPQLQYFQVLEAARKHKKDASSRSSIDSLHFKLKKPIKDPHHHNSSSDKTLNKIKKRKKWWNALLLFKWKGRTDHNHGGDDVHYACRAQAFRASISGPVYITESSTSTAASYRTCSSSGPISMGGGQKEIPYLSLRELNLEQQKQRASPSSMPPIYLVT